MTTPMRAGLIGLLAALAVPLQGCVSPSSSDPHELSDASQVEAAKFVSCAPAAEQAIALLDAQDTAHPCGLALELDGDNLIVRPRARPNPLVEPELIARGPWPLACGEAARLCEFAGVEDRLGPIVIATVRGPESEVPVQVHVGWAAGDQLVFVETWYGPPSVGDHTRLGPVWALAPFDCDTELVLLPAARLPEAVNEQPSDVVRALSGAWRVEGGFALPPEQPTSLEPASCRALIRALP